jgi:hypothetical protein
MPERSPNPQMKSPAEDLPQDTHHDESLANSEDEA